MDSIQTHSKPILGDDEKQIEPKQTESDDPILERVASCISIATSPSPMSSPSSGGNTPQWSMMSASPHHGTSNQLSFTDEHPDWNAPNTNYDPTRIPSSIFSSKPSMPGEWSVTSNESLFSIHTGNSSFCRDERKSFSSTLPTLIEVSADREEKSGKMSSGSSQVQENDDVETPKSFISKHTSKDYDDEEEKGNVVGGEVYSSTMRVEGGGVAVPQIERIQESSRLSTGSTTSTKSFAFPVLVKDFSRREGLLKGDNGGMKSEVQPQARQQSEPELQQQPAETTAKPETSKGMPEAVPPVATAEPGCFSCFSCCSRCC
ncbi:unnamed protein product [Cuscuta epithymum]|uniref:Uncharacterized protein n=1 Tax=Cuscuta epithymum TaxID=186058 RepID=A0AAV0E8G1_9ASTE|nr:unnamed protein product [Cuscuta epithymum]